MAKQCCVPTFGDESEFGGFGEVEIVDFHGGNDHFEGFFGGGADGGRHGFDVFEELNERLVKTKVADGGCDFAVFHQEQAVAGHAGHDFFVGIDFTDIPDAGDQQTTIG